MPGPSNDTGVRIEGVQDDVQPITRFQDVRSICKSCVLLSPLVVSSALCPGAAHHWAEVSNSVFLAKGTSMWLVSLCASTLRSLQRTLSPRPILFLRLVQAVSQCFPQKPMELNPNLQQDSPFRKAIRSSAVVLGFYCRTFGPSIFVRCHENIESCFADCGACDLFRARGGGGGARAGRGTGPPRTLPRKRAPGGGLHRADTHPGPQRLQGEVCGRLSCAGLWVAFAA